MRSILLFSSALFLSACGQESSTVGVPAEAPDEPPTADTAGPAEMAEQTVEVGCAACIYSMPGITGCDHVAAKIAGKPVLLSGANADAHSLGLCSAPRTAVLAGTLVGDVFTVTKLELK